MKIIAKDKEYSTFSAKCLGYKHVGEYGHDDGFEEQLYLAEDGQHFIYGVGGPNSPYVEPQILLVDNTKAAKWIKRTK